MLATVLRWSGTAGWRLLALSAAITLVVASELRPAPRIRRSSLVHTA